MAGLPSGRGALRAPPEAERRTAQQHNCLEHFDATLRILKPTIVILQGRGVANWSTAVLPVLRPRTDSLYVSQIDNAPVVVCSLSHPAAHGDLRWGDSLQTPYLREVVKPTLAAALSISRRLFPQDTH